MDIKAIMANVQKASDTVAASGQNNNNRKWGVAFLKDGEHKLRILADAKDEVVSVGVYYHTVEINGETNVFLVKIKMVTLLVLFVKFSVEFVHSTSHFLKIKD